MVKNLIQKVELSKILGISKSCVSKDTKPGGRFSRAMVGKKIDLNHEDIQKVILKKGGSKNKETEFRIKKIKKNLVVDVLEDIGLKEFENMTVKEIIQKYSNIEILGDFIKTRKLIADTEHKQIQMAIARGEYLKKETLGKACFGYLEVVNNKLLEVPDGIADRLQAVMLSNANDKKIKVQEILLKQISKIMRDGKDSIIEELKSAVETPER